MATEEIKNDIWKMIKNIVPVPAILIAVAYIICIWGGGLIYKSIIASEKLGEQYIQNVTDTWRSDGNVVR